MLRRGGNSKRPRHATPARAAGLQHSPITPRDVPACVSAAIDARAALLADPRTNALRLFNAAADGIDGFVLEKLANVLIAQLHEGRLQVPEADLRRSCESVLQRCGGVAVYRKMFPRDRSFAGPRLDAAHTVAAPWIGVEVPPEFAIREYGVNFCVRPYDGYSTGLFLEHRENRATIRQMAHGRRVLNTFAYTCGFSVAAALGGAAETVSVDVSKKYLEWGKRNFAANGIALDGHWFICSDVLDYYRRAERQGRRFDLIILDPPTFGREKNGRAFSFAAQAQALVNGAVRLLNPGGQIMLATNHRATSAADLERLLHAAAATAANAAAPRLVCRITARPPLPADFAGDAHFSKTVIAQFQS